MTREEKLEELVREDFLTKKYFLTLTIEEASLIRRFLEENEALDYNQFTEKVNRMGLSSSGYPTTKNAKHVRYILFCLRKTVPGFYGYEEQPRWIHPLDR